MLELLQEKKDEKIIVLNEDEGLWRDYLYLEENRIKVGQKFYSINDFTRKFNIFFDKYKLPYDYTYQYLSNLSVRDLSFTERIKFLSKIPVNLSFFEKIKFLLKIPYVKLEYSNFSILNSLFN